MSVSPIGLRITEFALPGADVLQVASVLGRWECTASWRGSDCHSDASSAALFVR